MVRSATEDHAGELCLYVGPGMMPPNITSRRDLTHKPQPRVILAEDLDKFQATRLPNGQLLQKGYCLFL
jgi:hypothetical protein